MAKPEKEDEELAARLEEMMVFVEQDAELTALLKEAAEKIRHLSKHVVILRAMYQNRQVKEK